MSKTRIEATEPPVSVRLGGGECLNCADMWEEQPGCVPNTFDTRDIYMECPECDGCQRAKCWICSRRLDDDEDAVSTFTRGRVAIGDSVEQYTTCDRIECQGKAVSELLERWWAKTDMIKRLKDGTLAQQLEQSIAFLNRRGGGR